MAYSKGAQSRYQKEKKRKFSLSLSVNTCADIIGKLDSVDSVSGYICTLIREDIKDERKSNQ